MKPLEWKGIQLSFLLAVNLTAVAAESPRPVPLSAVMPSATATPGADWKGAYFFDHAPFVSPKIVQDLCAWISDQGDQVVGINLLESQGTNRYFGEIEVTASQASGRYPFVCVRGKGDKDAGQGEVFGYQYIGTSSDGVVVLYTSYDGGGSGLFESLLLLTLEKDAGIDIDWGKQTVKKGHPRLLLKKLGEIALGDRWHGDLRVQGKKLFIGKDEGTFGGRNDSVEGRPMDVSKEMLIDLK